MPAAAASIVRPAHMNLSDWLLCAISLAVIAGCAVNPSTGRRQLIVLPAAQIAHSNIGFSLSTVAQNLTFSSACAAVRQGHKGASASAQLCPGAEEMKKFKLQVERVGAKLAAEIHEYAPEMIVNNSGFHIGVAGTISASTVSNVDGRILLASDLAALEPTDDVVAFMIAREMGHVIARHGEEDSGARIAFSTLTALLPAGGVIAKFIASLAGSQVLKATWAEAQRREADEIALVLLQRCGRSAATIAFNLKVGLRRGLLSTGEWNMYFAQSIERVSAIVLAHYEEPQFKVIQYVANETLTVHPISE